MMNKKPRIVSIAFALSALIALSAIALTHKPAANASPSLAVSSPKPMSAPVVKGQAIEEKEGKEGDEKEDEKDGDSKLTASITPAQATTAALAAQPGAAGKTELEDEDGKSVYGVEVTAADGKKYDVKVDGTSGKVLKSDAGDEDDEKDGVTDDD